MKKTSLFKIAPFFLILQISCENFSEKEINFLVMADSPYTNKDFLLKEKELKDIPESAKFIIHLGDIKVNNSDCTENLYKDFKELLKQSPIPVFIVPGDNDYILCKDPSQAKQFWDQYIFEFEKNWKLDFPVKRQK
jgi:predicted phosphodiesterase